MVLSSSQHIKHPQPTPQDSALGTDALIIPLHLHAFVRWSTLKYLIDACGGKMHSTTCGSSLLCSSLYIFTCDIFVFFLYFWIN